MGGIAAVPHVAAVQDKLSVWYRAFHQFVRNAMRQMHNATDVHASVSGVQERALPQPAVIGAATVYAFPDVGRIVWALHRNPNYRMGITQ